MKKRVANRVARFKLALTEESVSVPARWTESAGGERPESTAHLFHFTLVQFTSALADQHPVLVIHVLSPFV
jgi:hypothetical protein